MNDLESMAIRRRLGRLEILDQTKLPNEERWIPIESYKDMIKSIQSLQVRGAPLIGVAAALSLVIDLDGISLAEFVARAEELRRSRPTAVNLMYAIDRLVQTARRNFDRQEIEGVASSLFAEDVELCGKIGRFGSALIDDGDGILTHCNTGGLATAGGGTALNAIKMAHFQKKSIHVYVDETRPLLQGARLTCWELSRAGVPHTLICDNMAASLMARGKIQKCMTGADRIARNGDTANKVGTYGLAVLCHHHRVPFYIAAPRTTVDSDCLSGKEIPIEERSRQEICGDWQLVDSKVFNPAFDVTPAELISKWILDSGIYDLQGMQDSIMNRGMSSVGDHRRLGI